MSVRSLERRITCLGAKKGRRGFQDWTDQELEDAVKLYLRTDRLSPDEEKQLQRYSARMPPLPQEIAALPKELVEQQVQELMERFGFGVKE